MPETSPQPAPGWVLIRVKAFGLNRSELFTRQGHSPGVEFPRVLGIEAVGTVEEAPGGEFEPGQTVATAMVGDAWKFDRFSPMDAIPSTVNLTTYSGGSTDFIETPLQTVVTEVEEDRITPRIGRVFQLDDIVEAHRCMEDNAAAGKIVVLT